MRREGRQLRESMSTGARGCDTVKNKNDMANTRPPSTLIDLPFEFDDEAHGAGTPWQGSPERRSSYVAVMSSWGAALVGASFDEVVRALHERADHLDASDVREFATALDVVESADVASVLLRAVRDVMTRCPLPPNRDELLDLAAVIKRIGSAAIEGTGPTDQPDPDSSDPFEVNAARALTSKKASRRITVEQGSLAVDAIVAEIAIGSSLAMNLCFELFERGSPALLKRLKVLVETLAKGLEVNGVGDWYRCDLTRFVKNYQVR